MASASLLSTPNKEKEMDDSDWIFTADKSDEYPNAIVHRRKEDSLAVWTYNKACAKQQ